MIRKLLHVRIPLRNPECLYGAEEGGGTIHFMCRFISHVQIPPQDPSLALTLKAAH